MSSLRSDLGSVSEEEAIFYYYGLPSSPRLIYRSSPKPWDPPTGLEAYHVRKELRPVFNHKISSVWDELGPKVCQVLDTSNLLWTSIDVVRFKAENDPVGPVVLWIGVNAKIVSYGDARASANACLSLLQEFGIYDVEVEFRSSDYTRSGPGLLRPVMNKDHTADLRNPLTAALGLPIGTKDTLYAEGTGGLYLAQGGSSDNILLLTARHVLFPPNECVNDDYPKPKTSTPRRDVVLLGTQAFSNFLRSINLEISEHADILELFDRQIEMSKEKIARAKGADDVDEATMLLKDAQTELKWTNEKIETLKEFYDQVEKDWSSPKERVIGHVVRAPPITFNAGPEGFTEDFAVVQLNVDKFKNAFKGNVIDLGTKIRPGKFNTFMHARHGDGPTTFKYPVDRLLRLQGTISLERLHNPSEQLDCDGEKCLMVIKHGSTTGVTIGRANGIFSYVREYLPNQSHHTSKEWAILPYDKNSGPFSELGDSGAIIVDGLGHIGGLLTGGSGKEHALDITYATPFYWLLHRIKANGFPDADVWSQS